jgi:CheY-like chemotaxis protein
MTRLLIVEDQPNDLRNATETARSLGFTEVEARSSAMAAKLYLEKAVEGDHPLPEVILLDLDLGYESGFELLRFWHGNPNLSAIPMIVWTVMGEDQREITAFISKTDGLHLLKEALTGLARSAS